MNWSEVTNLIGILFELAGAGCLMKAGLAMQTKNTKLDAGKDIWKDYKDDAFLGTVKHDLVNLVFSAQLKEVAEGEIKGGFLIAIGLIGQAIATII